jgi:hypothetical protein
MHCDADAHAICPRTPLFDALSSAIRKGSVSSLQIDILNFRRGIIRLERHLAGTSCSDVSWVPACLTFFKKRKSTKKARHPSWARFLVVYLLFCVFHRDILKRKLPAVH